MPSLLRGLNESQKSAVLHTVGPLLVLAGAGSGKTRVLTTRIARLVREKKAAPQHIVALTFTNKAATEMKQRVSTMIAQDQAQKLFVGTFHSFGLRILRDFYAEAGLDPQFSIADEHIRKSILKESMRVCTKAVRDKKPEFFATRISLGKNEGLTDEQLCDYQAQSPSEKKVVRGYLSRMRKMNLLDFDDLLQLPLRLLQSNVMVRNQLQNATKFLCIDEYQDTNVVQMNIARIVAWPQNNLMVVGDDDQSIYSWRGAKVQNILQFEKHYPDATKIVLNYNYRSTPEILGAAFGVVERNKSRSEKKVVAAKTAGEPIMHFRGDDENEECQWVAQSIVDNQKSQAFYLREQALLFRTNMSMRRFEEELRARNIPYKIIGAMSFFDSKEIKDVLSYMRFFANHRDELSLLRMIKVPDRSITAATIRKCEELASLRGISLFEALQRAEHAPEGMRTSSIEACHSFCDWVQRSDEAIKRHVAEGFEQAITEAQYLGALKKAYRNDPTLETRVENVQELLRGLHVYIKRKPGATLTTYLNEMMLSSDNNQQKNDKKEAVTLMTYHKAKGLEFPCVFLVGLDNEIIPSPRSVAEGNIEEERRLFYVGMTRAERRLILTYPKTKLFRGKDKEVVPTQFLFEIPPQFLDGPLGQKEDQQREEFLDDFFETMQQQLQNNEPPASLSA